MSKTGQHNDRPIMCLECDATVELWQAPNGTLKGKCECKDEPVKVASKLPEGWA